MRSCMTSLAVPKAVAPTALSTTVEQQVPACNHPSGRALVSYAEAHTDEFQIQILSQVFAPDSRSKDSPGKRGRISMEEQKKSSQRKDRGSNREATQGHRRISLTCFVNQALSLFLHPFLIVVFHILFVFSATAVGFSHGGLRKTT